MGGDSGGGDIWGVNEDASKYKRAMQLNAMQGQCDGRQCNIGGEEGDWGAIHLIAPTVNAPSSQQTFALIPPWLRFPEFSGDCYLSKTFICD